MDGEFSSIIYPVEMIFHLSSIHHRLGWKDIYIERDTYKTYITRRNRWYTDR